MISEHIMISINPALKWSIFVIIFIIAGFALFHLIFKNSKNPKDWKHRNIYSKNHEKANLKKFADSIRFQTLEYDYNTSLEEVIQMIFFKKIEYNKGLSVEELYEIKNKNPEALRNIIADDDIYNWILNSEKEKDKNSFFWKKKTKEEGEYLKKINMVIDKMEAWV